MTAKLLDEMYYALVHDDLTMRLSVEYLRSSRRAWRYCSDGRIMVAFLWIADYEAAFRTVLAEVAPTEDVAEVVAHRLDYYKGRSDDGRTGRLLDAIDGADRRVASEPRVAAAWWLLKALEPESSDGYDMGVHPLAGSIECLAGSAGDPDLVYARFADAVRSRMSGPPALDALVEFARRRHDRRAE